MILSGAYASYRILAASREAWEIIRKAQLVQHNYSEAVAKPLRKAMYYHRYRPNFQKAIYFYQRAELAATQEGMDETSSEYLAICNEWALLLEQNGNSERAIGIWKLLAANCSGRLDGDSGDSLPRSERSRLVKWLVRICVKLSILCEVAGGDDLEPLEYLLRAHEYLQPEMAWEVAHNVFYNKPEGYKGLDIAEIGAFYNGIDK
jgi:hypothetical protein